MAKIPKGQPIRWYQELIEENIKKAIPKLVEKKSKYVKGQKYEWLDKGETVIRDGEWIQDSLASRIKKLKRGFGSMQFTDPKFFETTGFFKEVIDKVDEFGWEVGLDKAWGSWDAKLHDYKEKGNQWKAAGKVGHHRIALSLLREAVENVPGNVRADLKRIASKHGYNLGNEFVSYLDPAAHKLMGDKIRGVLSKRIKGPISREFVEALADRSAHSKFFGGERGFTVPKELVKPGATGDEIFKVARPYLEMAKIGDENGLRFSALIESDAWSTQGELEDLIKRELDPLWEADVKKAEALTKRMNVDLYEAGWITDKGKRAADWATKDSFGTTRTSVVPTPYQAPREIKKSGGFKKNYTIDELYEGQYHFPDEIEANGKAVLERQSRGWLGDGSSKIGKLKLGDVAGNVRKGEALANIGTGIVTGNPLQATAGGAGLALQTNAVQKRMATLAAEIVAKRASKSALKLVPGVDIGISGAEAWGYLKEGKLDQAGIASLSGAVGWIPGAGDFTAALLDASNTALDIKRLSLHQRGEDTRRPKLDIDEDDFKLGKWLRRAT